MSGQRGDARRVGLMGALVGLVVLSSCAVGAPGPTPTVPIRTPTPRALATPRPTATPRSIVTLEPTATAGPPTTATRAAVALTPASTTGATPAATAPAAATTARPPAFSAENAYRHVEELSISIGIRASGTDGEAKAADYIAEQFSSLGLTVARLPFNITTFQDKGSTLTLDVEPRQIQPIAMYYSGAGQVEGILVAAGLGALADFQNDVARGKIAVVERGGGLDFLDKARNAKAGGALAVIVFNNVDGPVQGSLKDPFDLPVVSLTRADGQRLRRLMEQRTVRAVLKVNVATELKPSQNVLATAANPSPRLPIIVVGAHLDTVPAGPGANDNASGVGVMLELARVLAREQRADIRFVAFGAEEIGLLGSRAYVEKLTNDERNRMVAMINLDMLAVGPTLNIGGDEDLVTQTITIAERMSVGRVTRLTGARVAASDHASFMAAGIPSVFIHRQDDPNYHTGNDRAQFVKTEALQAAGAVSLRLIEQLLEKKAA